MDDIDVTIPIQPYWGMDKADSKEEQQLNLITKPFKKLNLVYQHNMMVTEDPDRPNMSLVCKHPDPHYGVTPTPKEAHEDVSWRKRQDNKTHLSQDMTPDLLETSEVPPVKEVRKGRRKNLISYRVPMTTEEEQDIWRKFQELAEEKEKWSERKLICLPDDIVALNLDEPIVHLLARFAVDTYNALCVKANISEGIRMTKILEFKYVKICGIYANYITVEAMDNGLNCLYKALVQTLPSDGRKTLVRFHPPAGWQPFGLEKQGEASENSELLTPEKKTRKGVEKQGEASENSELLTPEKKTRKGVEKQGEASENSELLTPEKKTRKGKKKGNKAAGRMAKVEKQDTAETRFARFKEFMSAHANQTESRELADWNELRIRRTKALKEPPSGTGLRIDSRIGGYSYLIGLKEFKHISY